MCSNWIRLAWSQNYAAKSNYSSKWTAIPLQAVGQVTQALVQSR